MQGGVAQRALLNCKPQRLEQHAKPVGCTTLVDLGVLLPVLPLFRCFSLIQVR